MQSVQSTTWQQILRSRVIHKLVWYGTEVNATIRKNRVLISPFVHPVFDMLRVTINDATVVCKQWLATWRSLQWDTEGATTKNLCPQRKSTQKKIAGLQRQRHPSENFLRMMDPPRKRSVPQIQNSRQWSANCPERLSRSVCPENKCITLPLEEDGTYDFSVVPPSKFTRISGTHTYHMAIPNSL